MKNFKRDKLTEAELELIGSYLDGELGSDMAEKVARRIQHDPIWAAQVEQLKKLDNLLGTWSVDAAPAKFNHKLRKRIHRSRPGTYIKWAAPLATAACIAIASWLSLGINPPAATQTELALEPSAIHEAIKSLPQTDRFVVENLDWLEDYQLLSEFETIEAMEQLDKVAHGTGRLDNHFATAR